MKINNRIYSSKASNTSATSASLKYLSVVVLGLFIAACSDEPDMTQTEEAAAPATSTAQSTSAASTQQAAADDSHIDARLMAVIEGDHRSDANSARDVYRNPYETLTFFGIQPDFTVVELYPGAGWYTEILAPYLRDEGKLIAATYPRGDDTPGYMRNANTNYDALLESAPDHYDSIELVGIAPQSPTELAEPGSVDMILDFRNAHNWMNWGAEAMLARWHDALKPGGIVGITDHRMDEDREAGAGYIHASTLVEVMEAAGFRYLGSSSVNANPRDTKDHDGGVWMLPPNLRGVSEEDREHYLSIGESDRLTMKFIKD